jgi:hypothetical protein
MLSVPSLYYDLVATAPVEEVAAAGAAAGAAAQVAAGAQGVAAVAQAA